MMQASAFSNQTISHTTITVKDPWSAFTHFWGILVASFLSPVLLVHAADHMADRISLFSIAVFSVSMILLYTASTIYHTFNISRRVNLFLKKWDHMMIFVLIAGSYTPVCLIPLRDGMGKPLLLFVWGFAIAGILFKFFWVTCPKWISSILYIGLGWSCILAIPSLFQVLSTAAFIWLLIGGLIYTAGGIIYALKLQTFNNRFRNFGSHEIFHLFVLAGNLCHVICVYLLF